MSEDATFGRKRSPRFAVLSTTVAMVATFLASTAPTEAQSLECAGRINGSRGWTTVLRPEFPPPDPGWEQEGMDGDNAYNNNTKYDYAIDEKDRSLIFATDGYSVLRTKDGGCRWEEVFNIGAPDVAVQDPGSGNYYQENIKRRIRHIHTARSKEGDVRVFLEVRQPDGGASTIGDTYIWRSERGGDPGSWEQKIICQKSSVGCSGGEPTEGIAALRISRSDPDVMFFLAGYFWKTADGGDTWQNPVPLEKKAERYLSCSTYGDDLGQHCDGQTTATDFELDPSQPNRVLTWDSVQHFPLAITEDGAQTWRKVLEFRAAEDAAVAPRGGPTRIAVLPSPDDPENNGDFDNQQRCEVESQYRGECFFLLSDDGGNSWTRIPMPTVPYPYQATSILFGKSSDTIYVSGFLAAQIHDDPAKPRRKFLNQYSVKSGKWVGRFTLSPFAEESAILTDTTGGERPTFWGVVEQRATWNQGKPPRGYGNLTIYTPRA